MIFTEFRFLFFFLVAFAVHWGLPGNRSRKVWLLLCSNVFYGAWDWRFLGLLWFTIIVDYGVGLALARRLLTGWMSHCHVGLTCWPFDPD